MYYLTLNMGCAMLGKLLRDVCCRHGNKRRGVIPAIKHGLCHARKSLAWADKVIPKDRVTQNRRVTAWLLNALAILVPSA